MIHRAIFGTMERFIGGLIEHFAGAFPVWLAPVQVRVLPVTEAHADAAALVAGRLREGGLRVELDDRNETLKYRVREGELQKVPYLAVVGEREAEKGTVAVRRRGAADKQVEMPLEEFLGRVQEDVRARAPD
jgi:threonyl-tRNA synthetase